MSLLDDPSTTPGEPGGDPGRPRSWVLVLPPEPEHLSAVRERIETRGWALETSAGDEQVVGVVDGPRRRAELAAALPSEAAIEIIRLHPGREYRRQRGRQRFFSVMALGLALLTAIAIAVPVLGFLRPPDLALRAPEEVLAATVEKVPENRAYRSRFQEQPILIVNTGNERYHALSGRCTHMDACLLEWSPERRQIVCPCHGCVYDVYGNVLQGPPSVPLPTFIVERRNDALYVRALHSRTGGRS